VQRSTGIFLILVALFLVSCGQVVPKAVEGATGIQTNQQGDTVTIKGKDGESLTFSSQVPEELKDFPVPQGFKYDSSGSMSMGGDRLAVGTWTGKAAMPTVIEFYQKELPRQGWKEESNFTSDDGGLLTFSKGETDGVTITTSKDGDTVTLSVMFGKSSKK
jgi:hypothetical protein